LFLFFFPALKTQKGPPEKHA